MTPEEQLKSWVEGESIHNDERDECCPDFSCCRPELLQPVEVRRAFQAGSEKQRNALLMEFLGALLAGENVHVVGHSRSAG